MGTSIPAIVGSRPGDIGRGVITAKMFCSGLLKTWQVKLKREVGIK